MKSHERCCWRKEEAWTSDLLFSHLWWDLLFLESLVLTDQFESKEKRENTNIYQILSLSDSSICMCRSITRSHWCGQLLLCLCQVAIRILCHHKWKLFLCRLLPCIFGRMRHWRADTLYWVALLKKPWQFYSFKPIPLRKERDSGFLCRDVTHCWVWHSPSWTDIFERRGRKDKLSGELLVPAVCMWSPQVWLMGWFADCKVRVEVNVNPQRGNTAACPVSAEQVSCTVAKAMPAGKVCWPQWCRLE